MKNNLTIYEKTIYERISSDHNPSAYHTFPLMPRSCAQALCASLVRKPCADMSRFVVPPPLCCLGGAALAPHAPEPAQESTRHGINANRHIYILKDVWRTPCPFLRHREKLTRSIIPHHRFGHDDHMELALIFVRLETPLGNRFGSRPAAWEY